MKHGSLWLVVWFMAVGSPVWALDTAGWNQGKLALQSGVELNGELRFNWFAQVVQYREGTLIKAYSANQVRSFCYFDDRQNSIRTFVSIDYPVKSGRRQSQLLETVVSGYVSVYRTVRSAHKLIKLPGLRNRSNTKESVMDVDDFIYLVDSGDGLIGLDEFHSRVWPTVKGKVEKEMKRYATLVHEDSATTVDQLRMISIFNAIVEQPQPEGNLISVGL